MHQILIKNAKVLDPANKFFSIADIAVSDGKIVGVGDYKSTEAEMIIDAEGCLATPGLIDHHAHIYPMAHIGIPAEAVCFSTGVTTVVDAGSTGCDNYRDYQAFIRSQKLTIKSYLNLCSTGLASLPHTLENVSTDKVSRSGIKELFQEYPNEFLGIKIRTSKEIVGELGYEPVRNAVALAEEIGTTVMVHCTNPPGEMGELLSYLRKGDVITHMYMNKGSTILSDEGKITKEAMEARERGVIFEAADARAHFSFEVSEAAVREGFYPDIIATDLTKLSMHLRPTAFNMVNQINKYISIGIPIEKVIECCTSTPAKSMGLDGVIGSLSAGANADIAIFRETNEKSEFGDRVYNDPEIQLRHSEFCLRPLMTVKNGEVVYRDISF